MQCPQGGTPRKGGVLNDAQTVGHPHRFQRYARGKRGGADADQTTRQADVQQLTASFKHTVRNSRQAVRQDYAVQARAVGKGAVPDQAQAGEMTKPKYGQALATDKGAVADAGQPAVPTESQIGQGGAEGKCPSPDGFDRLRQGDDAQGLTAGESLVCDRDHPQPVRRICRHGHGYGGCVPVCQPGDGAGLVVKCRIGQRRVQPVAVCAGFAAKIQVCHTR